MDSTQNQDGGIVYPQPLINAEGAISTPTSAKNVPRTNETGRWQPNRSEIAAFLEQWDLEMEAMQQLQFGMSITGRHDFIVKRMSGLIDEEKVEAMLQTLKEQNASSADTAKE